MICIIGFLGTLVACAVFLLLYFYDKLKEFIPIIHRFLLFHFLSSPSRAEEGWFNSCFFRCR